MIRGLDRRVLKNALWNIFGFVWPSGLFLFSIPILVQALGMRSYGVWVLLSSAVSVFDLLNLGLGEAAVKYVAHFHATRNGDAVARIVWGATTISSGVALLAVIMGSFGFTQIMALVGIESADSAGLRIAFECSLVTFGVNLLLLVAVSVLRGLEQFHLSAQVTAFTDSLRVGSVMVGALFGAKLAGIAALQMVAAVIGLTVAIYLVRRQLPELRRVQSPDLATMRLLLPFAGGMGISGVASLVRANAGVLIVSRILGPEAVPVFSIPFQITNRVLAICGSLAMGAYPTMAALHGSGRRVELDRLFHRLTRLAGVWAIVICGTLAVFAEPILGLWIGRPYGAIAGPGLSLLAIGIAGTVAATVPYYLVLAMAKVSTVAWVQSITAVVALVGTPICIRAFGQTGAAAAYAVSSAVPVCYVFAANRLLAARSWPHRTASQLLPVLAGLIVTIGLGHLMKSNTLSVAEFVPRVAFVMLTSLGVAVTFQAASYRLSDLPRGDAVSPS